MNDFEELRATTNLNAKDSGVELDILVLASVCFPTNACIEARAGNRVLYSSTFPRSGVSSRLQLRLLFATVRLAD